MKHLSTSQFANLFGITRQAVARRVKRGDIKAEMVGGVWSIPFSEVERWKPSHKATKIMLVKNNSGKKIKDSDKEGR